MVLFKFARSCISTAVTNLLVYGALDTYSGKHYSGLSISCVGEISMDSDAILDKNERPYLHHHLKFFFN